MKHVQYTCDRCDSISKEEMNGDVITVEILKSVNCLQRFMVNEYGKHLCNSCMGKLRLSLSGLVSEFLMKEK